LPSIVDLIEIHKIPEGKTLEFKRYLSFPAGALEAIVTLANTSGGTLRAGVEDRTRHVRRGPDALDVQARLASLVSDRISVRLVPEIEILPWCWSPVLALQVHHLIGEGPSAGVCAERGPA
jgi:predicted HTH transcriptional regulator